MEVFLVYTAERPEEVPQPRPQPLQRVVVDLADPVPVVVPRPLTGRVADRGVRPAHRGQSVVPAPLVGEDARHRPGRPHHHAAERLAVGALAHRQPALPPLATDDPAGRRAVVLPGAVPARLVAPPPRRVVRVGVRDAFFPPHSGTPRPPPRPGRPAASGPGCRRPGPGAGVAASGAPTDRSPARGPAGRWARPGRTRGRSGPARGAAAWRRAGPSR